MSKIKLDTRIEIVYTIFTVERETQTGRNVVKLLTKAIEKKLPPLYTNENKTHDQVKIPVKFFTPWTNWTWYATEYDPINRRFYGLVVGFEKEFGFFTLDELQRVSGPFGLKIERDILWDMDTTLADIFSMMESPKNIP